MNREQFVQTLEAVLNPDTNVLKQATETLRDQYYKNPESLLILVQVIREHPNQHIRQLAAVEARSLVAKFWGKDNAPSQIPENVKAQIRESVLQSATQDSSSVVRHSAARLAAAIARVDLPQGNWLELPNITLQASASQKVDDRECGTYLLYTLLETLADVVVDRWRDFLQVFAQTINDQESMNVRVNTLLALGRLSEVLIADECPEAVEMFKQIMPSMVSVLEQVAKSDDDEKANPAFEVFQTLLLVDSALTSSHLRSLVEFFSNMSVDKSLSDDIRSKALSFLLSALRHKKMKLQALRVGETLTHRAMELVTEYKETEDAEDMTPSRTALALLDTMAGSLPPSQVVVPLLNVLPQYCNNADPAYRRAGILSLGFCVEGAPDFIVTQLSSIFPIVLQLLNDPVDLVRKSALHCVTQLADDLAEELGKEHARLIPILVHMLETGDGPEMWCRACNAIDAVLCGVEQSEVEKYLPTLMPKLTLMFQHDDFKVKGAAVGGIGSAALAAKDSFTPYYEPIMHALSPYLSIKDSEDELDLRGVVLDCMSSIAEAVGMQEFTKYVQPLMQSAEEALHLGHPRLRETSFMFFGTIARLYGEDFAPFLQLSTDALFASLEQDEVDEDEETGEITSKIVSVGAEGSAHVDVNGIVDMDGSDDEDDDDIWEELSAVNAIAIEKEVAADTLGEILTHCRNGFLPYLERTVTILADRASHPYEGVRKSSIGTLWRAYAALWQVSEERGMQKWEKGLPLKVQPTDELQKLATVVRGCTLENFRTETDRSTVRDICLNMAETLKLCGPALLADSDGSTILEVTTQIVLILTKQHPCQLDEDEEDDIPDLQESAEYDWQVIDACMDMCLGLAEALGPQYADVWKILGQNMSKYASSSDPRERSTAVGVIAESIKFMEQNVTPYTDKLLKLLKHRLSDEDQETRANATYGVGLLCLHSQDTQAILAEYPTILRKMESLLGPGVEANPRLLDNSAGCIARMIMAHPEAVPLGDVLPALVGLLPLKEDYEENAPVFDMLVKLYQREDQTVFGLTGQFLPIFQTVLGEPEEQLADNTRAHLIELLKFLRSKDAGIYNNFPQLAHLAQ